MWFCKKKEPNTDYSQIFFEERNRRIKTLEDKFKKGMKFTYLGVDCVVTNTVDYCSARAMLKADYVDKNGVIRSLSLSYEEAMRIET